MEKDRFASNQISSASLTISPPGQGSQPDYWGVVEYELAMFHATLGKVHEHQIVMNAFVESMLLHARNLCEFVLPDAEKKKDDIKLSDLFGDWNTAERYDELKASIDELRVAYGKSGDEASQRWTLNKRLAHPTKPRANNVQGHNYTELVRILQPKIQKVFDQILALRGNKST